MSDRQPSGRDEVEVAHEALIRHWPRLRAWLDQDRAALLLRETIREAAQEWARHDRDESYLAHRGRRLAEAEALAHHPRFTLNAQEQAYLDASVALREREEQEREAQQQRELAAARQLAEEAEARGEAESKARREAEQRVAEQAVAAGRLRKRLMIAVGLGALALLAAIGAFWGFRQAGEQQAVAEVQRVAAVAAAGTAKAESTRADVARADAEAERSRADDQAGTAEAERAEAVAAANTAEAESHRADEQASTAEAERRRANEQSGTAEAEVVVRSTAEAQALVNEQLARTREAEAATARARAEQEAKVARSRQLAAQAVSHVTDRPDLALLLSIEAVRQANTVEARGSLLKNLASNLHLTAFLRGHTSPVLNVAFSPDGGTLASASQDGSIHLWNPASGELRGEPLIRGVSEEAFAFASAGIAFSPDGKTLASTGCSSVPESGLCDRGEVRLWDAASGGPQDKPSAMDDHRPLRLAFSPVDPYLFATVGADGTVQLWDAATGQPRGEALGDEMGHEPVTSVTFSPDGTTLASGGCEKPGMNHCGGGEILLWDVARGQPRGDPLLGHTDWVFSVAFSSVEPNLLASASADGTIILWDVASGQPRGEPLAGHTEDVTSVAFSPDGATLASAGWDGTVRLWDVASGQPRGEPLVGHAGAVTSVAFSPDGATLASGGADGVVVLWSVAARQRLAPQGLVEDYVWPVAFSPDGTTMASSSTDGTVILWNVAGGQPRREARLTGHSHEVTEVTDVAFSPDGVMDLAFSPDGATLASAGGNGTVGNDGTVRLWDVASGQPRGEPISVSFRADFGLSVAFNADGTTLAHSDASQGWQVVLRDATSGERRGDPLVGHKFWLTDVAFSPVEPNLLASASGDGTIILWDAASGRPRGEPLDAVGTLNLAFSPVEPNLLASASTDGTVILWDTASGERRGQPLTGHRGDVTSVAFSPDGAMLASGGNDGTVRLWDVASGEQLGEPLVADTNGAGVVGLAFSPDGATLASGGGDGVVHLWDLGLESWQAQACALANRNLSSEEWTRYLGPDPYRATCPNLPPSEGEVMATPAIGTPATPSASTAVSGATPVTRAATPVTASTASASGTVVGTAYTSPTFGFSLEWDEPWLATLEESAAGRDVLVLYNGVSAVRIEGRPGFGGDAARCLQDAAAQLRSESNVINVSLMMGADGQPIRGGDRSHSFVVFSFTNTPEGEEVIEQARRLECWTLVLGESVLLLQQTMPRDGQERQMQTLEGLLAGLVLPAASSSPVDVRNPTPTEPTATPALADKDTSLAKWPPVPTPQVAD